MGVFRELFGEKWARDIESALYFAHYVSMATDRGNNLSFGFVMRSSHPIASLAFLTWKSRGGLMSYRLNFTWKDYGWHYDVIKRNHFPLYCPFVRGVHRSRVESPHKGPITRTFDVPLLLVSTNGLTNTQIAGNSRRHYGHRNAITYALD